MPAKAHRDFKIFPSFHGRALGDVLLVLLHRVPAWEVERLLAGRHVHIDGNVCTDPNRRLPSGAIVRVFEHEQAADASRGDVRLVHVDDDLVIVDKPAGMTATKHRDDDTNAERKDRSPTVEDLLPGLIVEWERSKAFGEEVVGRRSPAVGKRRRDETPASNRANDAPPRPVVIAVHRIDRDTSGLMVFARNKPTANSLLHQFARRSIDRVYHAVALGEVKKMRCDSYFVRDRGDGKRGSKSRRQGGVVTAAAESVSPNEELDQTLDGDDDVSTSVHDDAAEVVAPPITPIAGILRPGTRKPASSPEVAAPAAARSSSPPPPPVKPTDEEAQRAVTHLSPIRTIAHTGLMFTVVECRLESGRTHQIRIHLAEAGHPICGDRVYRGPMDAPQVDPIPAPRQALHAAELGFDHPHTGKRVVYRATFPGDLRRWLDRIEKPRRR